MSAECPVRHDQRATFREIQGIQERKRNIAGIARQMLAGTYDYTEHDQLLDTLQSPSTTKDEFLHVWHDTGKDVRNAGVAVLASVSVNDALAQQPERPPFGLIKSAFTTTPQKGNEEAERIGTISHPSTLFLGEIPNEKPFDVVQRAMHDTLRISLSGLIQNAHEAAKEFPDGPITRDYVRYARWIDIHRSHFSQVGQIDFIAGGLSNTAGIMGKFLEAAPEVVKREMGNVDVAANAELVTRASDKFITRLASLDLPTFLAFRHSLANRYGSIFLPARTLRIVEDGEGLHLDFTPEQYHKGLHSISEDRYKDIAQTVRTNCPAMIAFEGMPSAIQAVWNWDIDVAVNIWERQAA